MLKFTFKFILTSTCPFLLAVITWVPFMLGSGNLVCCLPRLKPSIYARVAPRLCPGVGLGVKRYNMSNLGTFYTRKLNLVCYLGHNLGTFLS